MGSTIRRHLLRLSLTALAALLGSGVILGLVQANVQEWAKASGNDQYLVRYLGPLMDKLAELTSTGPFVFITAMIMGGTLFLWADTFLRRWSEWRSAQSGKALSWQNVDRRLVSMTLFFVLIVAVVLAGAWVAYEHRQPAVASNVIPAQPARNVRTHLTLKFRQGSILPVAENLENIWRWYALSNIVVIASPEERKEIKTWSVFVALEKPVDAKQVTVTSNSALPNYEVKDFSDRSVVIAFIGDLVNLSIDIDVLAEQPAFPQIAKTGPATVSTTIPASAPIKPRYNEDEIRKMIGVMGTLRDLADKTIAPKTWAVGELSQSWERTLREIGPAAMAVKIKELSAPMLGAHNQINAILYDFQHYAEHIRPVVDGFEVVGAFDGASNELASELQEYANAQNVNVAKIVFNRFTQWTQANQALSHWIGQTDARVTAKTKVLREWNP